MVRIVLLTVPRVVSHDLVGLGEREGVPGPGFGFATTLQKCAVVLRRARI